MEQTVVPCPFCGSHNIGYSVKTTGRWERKYHVAMYCKDCNCYGKRILITPTETSRYDVERNIEYKQLAVDAWNTRKPIEWILVKLEECEKDCRQYKYMTDFQAQANAYLKTQEIIKEVGGFNEHKYR